MAIDEGRFEYLERALDNRRHFTELKEAVRHLEIKMDERFANVDVRFLEMDGQLLAIENRLTALNSKLESKFNGLDSKFETRFDGLELKKSESKFAGVQSQFDAVLKKMDSQFKWLVGIQFGVLVTVISVLLSADVLDSVAACGAVLRDPLVIEHVHWAMRKLADARESGPPDPA